LSGWRYGLRALLPWIVLALATSAPVLAQDGSADELACPPSSIQDERGAVLWSASDNEELTLKLLTCRAAAVLWFSPNEPLLRPTPRLLPEAIFPEEQPTDGTVYVRIRRLEFNGETARGDERRKFEERLSTDAVWSDPVVRAGANSQNGDLSKLCRVFVRYMYYFSRDDGVGSHPHDLESSEAVIKFEPCRGEGANGQPKQVVLETVTTSAHGAGWYTSILDITKADGFQLPPALLVEEGKHATTPDRDRDGVYRPNYDVNVNVNDAWGIRDVLSTKRLGGFSFRADMNTTRAGRGLRVFPKHCASRPTRCVNVAYPATEPLATYVLKASPQHSLCTGSSTSAGTNLRNQIETAEGLPALKQAMDQATGTDKEGKKKAYEAAKERSGRLEDLLDEKGFCTSKPEFRYEGDTETNLKTFLWKISPGPRSEYGYQNAAQRMSFAYRNDEGLGMSGIVPFGAEMPYFGGWIIGKVNIQRIKLGDDGRRWKFGYDVVYSPSASRVVDWYVALGLDSDPRDGEDARVHRAAEEIGLRLRGQRAFLGIRFWGARFGIRANSFGHPTNVRFITEVGAGSW
jgi:hypothetical protein